MTRETRHDLHDADDAPLLPPPDKLYAHHRRQLSAMLDGELSPDEAKFMLRRLEHDTALAGCWERWQVCGDTLRGQRNALLPAGFAARVARAIEDDALPAATAATAATASRPRIARWGGGAALAASVAVVALLVGRQLPVDPVATPATRTVAATPAAPGTPSRGAVDVDRVVAPVAARAGREAVGGALVADAASVDGGAAAAAAAASVATLALAPPNAVRTGRMAPSRVARVAVAQATAQGGPGSLRQRADRGGESPIAALAAAGFAPPDDAFAAAPLPPPRPWPRAVLPGMTAADGFSVGYGAAPVADGFAPFEPRIGRALAPLPLLSADVLAAPADPARPADDVAPPRP